MRCPFCNAPLYSFQNVTGKQIAECRACGKISLVEKSVEVVEQNGLIWSYRPNIRNVSVENLEKGIRDLIIEKVKDKTEFLDIGACTGVHSINLTPIFNRVFAIEPHPLNVEMMTETVTLNNIDNIYIFKIAAWDKPEILKLFRLYEEGIDGGVFAEKSDGGEILGKHLKNYKPEYISDVKPDNFIVENTIGVPLDYMNFSPSCVKIDVEGAELNVLSGLRSTLERCKPVVFVETHTFLGIELEDVKSFFREIGYDHFANLDTETLLSHDVFWYGNSVSEFDPEKYGGSLSSGEPHTVTVRCGFALIFRELKKNSGRML